MTPDQYVDNLGWMTIPKSYFIGDWVAETPNNFENRDTCWLHNHIIDGFGQCIRVNIMGIFF